MLFKLNLLLITFHSPTNRSYKEIHRKRQFWNMQRVYLCFIEKRATSLTNTIELQLFHLFAYHTVVLELECSTNQILQIIPQSLNNILIQIFLLEICKRLLMISSLDHNYLSLFSFPLKGFIQAICLFSYQFLESISFFFLLNQKSTYLTRERMSCLSQGDEI